MRNGQLLLACYILMTAVYVGCDRTQPTPSTASMNEAQSESNESQTAQIDSNSGLSSNREPVVDEDAVNDEGLIVLQDTDSTQPHSSPDSGAADQQVANSNQDSPATKAAGSGEVAGDSTEPGQPESGLSLSASSGGVDEDKPQGSAADDQATEPTAAASLGSPQPAVSPGRATDGTPTEASPKSGQPVLAAPEKADGERPEMQLASSQSQPNEAGNDGGSKRSLPVEANVATEAERNQKIALDWPSPQAVLFVSGQQHGYLEPCGCTGLEKQKGGLIRRDTLLTELRDRGWNLIPIDVGNQVRRVGRQPEIKFQSTVEAFKMMGYEAATLGVDDLNLSSVELIQTASSDDLNAGAFIATNVTILDPSFFPTHKIVESGGRKIGITAALGKEFAEAFEENDDVEVSDPVDALKPIVQQLQSEGCDFLVLLAHASLEESAELAKAVPGFDLVVTAGGFGEPTLHPEPIDGTEAVMVQVGTKGMYGGIVGLFDDPQHPIRYQKIAISSQFKDSPRMLDQFADYQQQLKRAGFANLGISPIKHPSGNEFVGSESCGDCHTSAFEVWENSPHVHATDSIVAANNDRGGIPRHHDPECISCHATGWQPQRFYPYATGFISPEETELMMGSGCENCHGPGKAHVDAEYGDVEVDNDTLVKLREQMVLRLDQARDRCLECHDLDNSPEFDFDEYWDVVKHYGKD